MFKFIFIVLVALQVGSLSYATTEGVELECGFFEDEEEYRCSFIIFTHDECILLEEEEIFQCSYDIGVSGLTDELSYFTTHDKDLYGSIPVLRSKSLLTSVAITNGAVQVQFDVSKFWSFSDITLEEARELVDKNLAKAPHTFTVLLKEEISELKLYAVPLKESPLN